MIRLHSSYRRLLDRLSLIYHRTAYTVGSTSSLTASLLARFGKRVYPTYEVSRTTIFESREQLLAFEAALATERKMEELLGELGTAKVGVEKTTADQRKEEREKGEREGIKLFESVEEEWKRYCEAGEVELAEEEQSVGAEEQKLLYYKKRFHPGWPLSRVAYKAASVYGKLVSVVTSSDSSLAHSAAAQPSAGDRVARDALGATLLPSREAWGLVRPSCAAVHELPVGRGARRRLQREESGAIEEGTPHPGQGDLCGRSRRLASEWVLPPCLPAADPL